jgi:hypothetical protein
VPVDAKVYFRFTTSADGFLAFNQLQLNFHLANQSSFPIQNTQRQYIYEENCSVASSINPSATSMGNNIIKC